MSRTPISRDSFRKACSRFATGVAIATVFDESGKPHGLTVNSFTSVSAEPPLVLICIDLGSSVLPVFQVSDAFGLNFLSAAQQEISNRFAVLPEGRFQGVDWVPGPSLGVPILRHTIGWMECRLERRIEAGDHIIFLAEVASADAHDGDPLLYFGSAYRQLA